MVGFELSGLQFSRTHGGQGEHQDVLVDDQVPGLAAGAALADVVELEERGPGHDVVVAAQAGEQRGAPPGRLEPGRGAGGHDGRGQVGQLASVAPGPGSDHDGPARPQQDGAAGQDPGESGEQVIGALVGEVGGVAAVAVVVLGDTPAAGAGLGADLAVQAGAVGRGGDDQRDIPAGAGGGGVRELAGVGADHLCGAGGAVAAGAGDAGGGQLRPPGLVLDADGVAAEVDGLEKSQLAGRFRRWWQVLGSNQRRLSRRFYRYPPTCP